MLHALKVFPLIWTVWIFFGKTVLAVNNSIPLTKCCLDNQAYVAELDLCREWKGQVQSQKLIGPTVHTVGRNAESVRMETKDFAVKHELTRCPAGYVGTSSNNFTFYEDGSAFSFTEQMIFKPEEFCLQESYPNGRLVARYCIPDSCHLTETCIRKCCPLQMAFDIPSMSCRDHSALLNVTLYNHTGYPIGLDPNLLFIRDGVAPQCRAGYEQHMLDQKRYQIRSKGWLHIFADPWCSGGQLLETDEYCVDHFMDVNKTVSEKIESLILITLF